MLTYDAPDAFPPVAHTDVPPDTFAAACEALRAAVAELQVPVASVTLAFYRRPAPVPGTIRPALHGFYHPDEPTKLNVDVDAPDIRRVVRHEVFHLARFVRHGIRDADETEEALAELFAGNER